MVNKSIQNRIGAVNFLKAFGFIFTLLCETTNGYFMDYSENTEIIEQIAGYNITLLCDLKGLTEEDDAVGIKYNWHFKPCGASSTGSFNCFDSNGKNDDWTHLPCEDNLCHAKLQLQNVSEKQSGLYKCTAVLTKSTNLALKLVRAFQLNVKKTSHKIPEFFDAFPLNQSVSLGSQALFQCRIVSEEHLAVKWFRRLPIDYSADYGNRNSMIYYNGQHYALMTTPRKKSIGHNLYLSKLILNEIRPQDQGFYACVAINVWGRAIREAYLHVKANEDLSYDYTFDSDEESYDDATETDPNEFWLLFLMPVGLALLPITVWVCYISHKRCRQLNEEAQCSDNRLADEQHMLHFTR